MKTYIIVDCCSGEDYSLDEPNILLVTHNKEEAEYFFQDEISNWEDGMENYDSDSWETKIGTKFYECTDYDGDSHRVMKLVEVGA